MRHLKSLLLLAGLSALCGCASTINLTTQQQVDRWAARAKTLAQTTSYIAVNPPLGRPENRPIFQAASDGLGLFVLGQNPNPDALYQDLISVDPLLQNPLYEIAASAVSELYQEVYFQFIAPTTNINWAYAVEVISGIQAGFDATLGTPPAPKGTLRTPPPSAVLTKRLANPKPHFYPIK